MQTISQIITEKIIFLLLIFICISTTSCTVGSDAEEKSKLNYLSGEHYKSKLNIGVLPVILTNEKVNTKIEGTILVNEYNPLKFTKLLLQKNNKTILKTSTNAKGSFKFNGYLTNGEYNIKVDSENLIFEKKITVEKYEIKDLLYIINETK